jgi:sugar lactone lactonase YvrE
VIRPLLEHRCELAEGPVWDAEQDALWWVDIPAGHVHRHALGSSDLTTLEVGTPAGAVALRAAGGLVAAVADGFLFLGEDGAVERRIPVEADLPGNRFNDGKVDARGRFWAGTMAIDESPGQGALYRLDTDGTVTRTLAGVGLSNGLDWSPDGRTFYYVDSLSHRVDAFDHDPASGDLSSRRTLVDLRDSVPDGLTVDADGCLWVAVYGGWKVCRYSPEGEPLDELTLPTRRITSCAFGGPGLDILFVTSAARPGRNDPAAGAVLETRPGVRGRLPNRFAA